MTGGELESTDGEQLFDLSFVYPLHLAAGSPRLQLMAALDELLMDFVLGSLPFVRIVPIRFVRPAISTGGAITLAEASINVIKRDPADHIVLFVLLPAQEVLLRG